MLRPSVRTAGLLLSLSLAGLLASACGKPRASDSPAPHAYTVAVKPLDTGALVIDGCPVTVSMVTLHPNDQRADYVVEVSDRVYVARCPTAVTTSAVQNCGKTCQVSDVRIQPVPVTDSASSPAVPASSPPPDAVAAPSQDVLNEQLVERLQALSPTELRQVIDRLSPDQRVALVAEALAKATPPGATSATPVQPQAAVPSRPRSRAAITPTP